MAKENNHNTRSHIMRCWQAHIAAQKQSGLSRAEYCRQHQLSYHTATYWSKRLSKKPSTQKRTTLVPVKLASSLQINAVPEPRSVLKVILPNRIAIEVDDDFSPAALTKLLMTLEGR